MIVVRGNADERHKIEPTAECELRLHRLEADARVLHVVENEFGAGLAADRRVAGREELESHRADRTAAGREPRLQWIWTQRISPRGAYVQASSIAPALMQLYRKAVARINRAVRK